MTEKGIMPATGSLVAPIEIATGKKAYFVGKPNPLMLRHGLKKLECHSADIAFVGDRMDTDIIAGIESNVDTVLVLSGVTAKEDIDNFPYRPKYVLNGVGDIVKAAEFSNREFTAEELEFCYMIYRDIIYLD